MTGQFEGALGIEDVLAREGVYVGTTAGVSMWPLLRHRRDTVVVEPCAGRLRVHDVPLYRRGDAYVRAWCALYPVRRIWKRARAKAARALRSAKRRA